jgi:hypothetical protein
MINTGLPAPNIYINMHIVRINKMILLGSNDSQVRKENCINEFLLVFTFSLWTDNT